jgi:hypothetical protein
MTLSITMLYHYAKCYCAEWRILFIVMLNVIMLSVIMLSVIMLNVIMLSVVAPVLAVWQCLSGYKVAAFVFRKKILG